GDGDGLGSGSGPQSGGGERAEPAEPAEPAGGSGPRTLPTRVRQASLAAPLRDGPADADTDADQAAAPEREVSADEMRTIFGAFQRGLDRGRKAAPESGERSRTNDEGTGHDG
ncbi:nitrate- and nitrite sensing domain-containing protein, partial [Streptomyces sp. NPDC054841]